jgi:hypothetical protein
MDEIKVLQEAVRRVVKEEMEQVIGEIVKKHLSLEEDFDPFSGRSESRWRLLWDGGEI